MRKMGFGACGGFRQGRAPYLRAPEGSLDGFRRMQDNRPQEGMGVLYFREGDISNEGMWEHFQSGATLFCTSL